MTIVGISPDHVIGGIDTHADVHVAAVVNHVGGVLEVGSFPTTTAGYRRLVGWLRSHGAVALVGVEGTGSYGVGVARYLARVGGPLVSRLQHLGGPVIDPGDSPDHLSPIRFLSGLPNARSQ